MFNSIQSPLSLVSINFATTNRLARAGQFLLYPCQKLWATHHVTLVTKSGQNRFDYARSHVMSTDDAPKWLQLCVIVLLIIPTFLGMCLIKAAAAFDEDFRNRLQWAHEIANFKNGKSLFKVEMLDDALEEYFDAATSLDAAKAKFLITLMEGSHTQDLEQRLERFSKEKQKIDLLVKECNKITEAICLNVNNVNVESDHAVDIDTLINESLKTQKTIHKLLKAIGRLQDIILCINKEKINLLKEQIYILKLSESSSKLDQLTVLSQDEIDYIAHKLKLPYAAQWMYYLPEDNPAIRVVAERILDKTEAFFDEFAGMVKPWFFKWMHNGQHEALLQQLLNHIEGKCQHSAKHAQVFSGLCQSLFYSYEKAAASRFLSMWTKTHFFDAFQLDLWWHNRLGIIFEFFLTYLKQLKVTGADILIVMKHVQINNSCPSTEKVLSRAPWVIIKEFLAIRRTDVLNEMAQNYPQVPKETFEKILDQGLEKSYLDSQLQMEWFKTHINDELDLEILERLFNFYFKIIKTIMFYDVKSFNKVYCYILTQSERNVIRARVNDPVDKARFQPVLPVPSLKQIILGRLHSIYRLAPQRPQLPLDLEEELNPAL